MEVINPLNILYKEIETDTQKKADRILKRADTKIAQLREQIAVRIDEACQALEQKYIEAFEEYRQDSDISLVLEKKRRTLAFYDTETNKVVNDYFYNLDSEKKLHICLYMLKQYQKILSVASGTVFCVGIDAKKVADVLPRILPDFVCKECVSISLKDAAKRGFSEGIFVQTSDGLTICKASIEQARINVMVQYRTHLRNLLFSL